MIFRLMLEKIVKSQDFHEFTHSVKDNSTTATDLAMSIAVALRRLIILIIL